MAVSIATALVAGSLLYGRWFGHEYVDAVVGSDTGRGDWFADSLAVDGDWLAVGAFRDDDAGENAGAVYLFRRERSGWTEVDKLVPPTAEAADETGFDVALQGDMLLVSALGGFSDPPSERSRGRVHVYVRRAEQWRATQELLAPDGRAGEHFGFSLALDGDRLAVGAKNARGGADDEAERAGAVYVYRRAGDEWSLERRLTAADGGAGDAFGSDLALRGPRLLVGAPEVDRDGRTNVGAVYGFEHRDGRWQDGGVVLTPPPDSSAVHFGIGLAAAGEHAFVGASHWAERPGGGAVHVFERVGADWRAVATLTDCLGEPSDMLGFRVAAANGRVIAGAHLADATARDGGAVAMFGLVDGLWRQVGRTAARDGDRDDHYGVALATDGRELFVGAERADVTGRESGALYIEPMTDDAGPPCP